MDLLYQTVLLFVILGVSSCQNKQTNKDWWKRAIFYQVYPRSFKDNNNDGIGDLSGIIEKLPHLMDAGVTAMWLSPIFESPQIDQGYDISNYTKIDSIFGTLDDFKLLLETAHGLGIKVILDFVPNHSSDQHPWFKNSVNRVEGYEDFYVWSDGKVDKNGNHTVPNNWVSIFGNSSWDWSEERQQYYYHEFVKAQPDLNFRSPKVREAMKGVLKYWMDLGVDGFRIDAVPYLVEDAQLRDEPLSGWSQDPNDYGYLIHNLTTNQPEAYEIIYEWREFLDNYTAINGGDDRVIMTEVYASVVDDLMPYYGTPDGTKLGAHFSFNFYLITDLWIHSTALDISKAINKWLDAIPDLYISNWVLGNHDQHRIATRMGVENLDGYNMLVTMLPGIGVTYNGEEIGQENGNVTFEQGQDPGARDPNTFVQKSRDFERTPFQWDDSVNAGFNKGAKPWLPVSEKYKVTNLASQNVPGLKSHYNIYRDLVQLRDDDVLKFGTTEVLPADDEAVLMVIRRWKNQSVVVLFNIGDDQYVIDASWVIPETNHIEVSSLNSNRKNGDILNPNEVILDPHESLVIKCTYSSN